MRRGRDMPARLGGPPALRPRARGWESGSAAGGGTCVSVWVWPTRARSVSSGCTHGSRGHATRRWAAPVPSTSTGVDWTPS
jgi:hypothetical protein